MRFSITLLQTTFQSRSSLLQNFKNAVGKRVEQAAEEGNCYVGFPPHFGGGAGPYPKIAKLGNTSKSTARAEWPSSGFTTPRAYPAMAPRHDAALIPFAACDIRGKHPASFR